MKSGKVSRYPWKAWGLFLAASAVAGGRSGTLLGWPTVWRGAALGFSISLASVALAAMSARRIAEGRAADWSLVLALAGGAAAFSLPALRFWFGSVNPLKISPVASLFGVALIYAVGLQTAWRLRWRERPRLWGAPIVWTLFTGLAGGMARMAAVAAAGADPADWILDLPSLMLLGGILGGWPFALLWLAAARLFDPAFSPQRWRNALGGAAARR